MAWPARDDVSMHSSCGRSPVIVIGMHRSGTALLTRLLEGLGLFAGWRQDENAEAYYFLALNAWLLRQAGASWQTPTPIRYLYDDRQARARALAYLRRALAQPRVLTYLGASYFRSYRTPAFLTVPWGWKDPRTTFTLPFWLALFPRARVIHIVRHGIDVAHSLQEREERVYQRWWQLRGAHPLLYGQGLWSARADEQAYVPCMPLERGLALWETYVQQARTHVQALGSQACEVRYEKLVTAPTCVLRTLTDFCDLEAGEGDIARVVAQVRMGHAYAYRASPELRQMARDAATRLVNCGYPAEVPLAVSG